MGITLTKKKIIIAVVAIILVGAGVAGYFYFINVLSQPQFASSDQSNTSSSTTTDSIKAEHQESLQDAQQKVDELVTSGDEASIADAEQIIEEQQAVAEQSGDDEYIVNTALTKASLLIETNQAQEALDTVLFPLNEKYGNNDAYKDSINSSIVISCTWR